LQTAITLAADLASLAEASTYESTNGQTTVTSHTKETYYYYCCYYCYNYTTTNYTTTTTILKSRTVSAFKKKE